MLSPGAGGVVSAVLGVFTVLVVDGADACVVAGAAAWPLGSATACANTEGLAHKSAIIAMDVTSRALRGKLSRSNVTVDVLIMRSHPLLEKDTAGVRAVYLNVTDGACLILIGLVMEGRSAWRREVHRCGMTLQA